MTDVDIDHLRSWIGREETASEGLSPTLVKQFCTTLGAAVSDGDIAPQVIHFCLTQPAAPMDALGRDGHPARGGFLPPVPLPRRMWAGGALEFHAPLRVGQKVTRKSVIKDVVMKQGRSGPLCFVTVEHEIRGGGELAVMERQDLVYREDGSGGAVPKPVGDVPQGDHTTSFMPTPTLLFRYSAMTFNGHRIHYDRDYAQQVEGYPGLVVHGPMKAKLMCHFAGKIAGKPPKTFRFRGLAPAFDGTEITLHARKEGDGMKLWTVPDGGPVSMEAWAGW